MACTFAMARRNFLEHIKCKYMQQFQFNVIFMDNAFYRVGLQHIFNTGFKLFAITQLGVVTGSVHPQLIFQL